MPSERIVGTIKFFRSNEGFGFITREDGKRDVFVHSEQLKASQILWLDVGCKLTFELKDEGRGPRAVNLQAVR